jgi:hypothetical protein
MPSDTGQLELALPPPRRAVRIPAAAWRQIMARPENGSRYREYVLPLRPSGCWPYLGTLSSSGAGSLWVRADDGGHMVSAHAFGYQLMYGVLEEDPEAGERPRIRHACDEAWCQNWAHWLPGGAADNLNDWLRRRWHAGSPLHDLRGPRGRAVAVREAALAARDAGASTAAIAAAVRAAAEAGMGPVPDMLF